MILILEKDDELLDFPDNEKWGKVCIRFDPIYIKIIDNKNKSYKVAKIARSVIDECINDIDMLEAELMNCDPDLDQFTKQEIKEIYNFINEKKEEIYEVVI